MSSETVVPPVRLTRDDDLALLPDLQLAAGDAFRGIGMADIADNPPLDVDELAEYQRVGRAWVITDPVDDTPVGFLIASLIDGCAHIEQVSVHPDVAGQGLGRRLLDHVAAWAADQCLEALTLTTFREVPWNAPYYRRLGFREVEAAEVTPGLRAVLDSEIAFGLDPASRVCMRRPLSST